MRVYGEFQRDRVGWFLGLTGFQLGVLAAGVMPVVTAVHDGLWRTAFALMVAWLALLAVVVVPVQGRTVVGWAAAAALSLVARRAGWSAYRSGLSQGRSGPSGALDLPGGLGGLRVHRGTTRGGQIGVVQHLATQVWSVTARLTHPGTGWATAAERDLLGAGLAAVLDGVCRAGLVSEVQVLVRVSTDDGTDRDRWLSEHRPPAAPSELARRVHDELRHHLTPAATRTETFVTVIVSERRLRRAARNSPGDLGGRAAVLDDLTSEVTALLTGPLGAEHVTWLSSAGLAEACRAGFDPGDASPPTSTSPPTVSTSDADPRQDAEPGSDVLWAGVGVARAVSEPGRYHHGRFVSVSSALLLPARGAALGALGPVLSGGAVGERRSLLVGFPVLPPDLAERRTASREWAADLGDGLRDRARVRPRAQTRADNATARAVDAKLVRGASLCRPYAVATTTVAADEPADDAARRLDGSIRRAGFTAQRLDLAHDVGFAAACLPLGLSLSPSKDSA